MCFELGIDKRVRFFGWREQRELPALYHACDFLVMPSVSTRLVREAWGLVANEAMNAGIPVIATDAVGAAAGGLIIDGETGLVVPERDALSLASALDELASDPARRATLGAGARARVQSFSVSAAADAFDQATKSAVTARRRAWG
jgi:glycosyltransferase involved in cell wall biosynthesis